MSTGTGYVVPRLVVLQVFCKIKKPNKNNKEDVEVLRNPDQKNMAVYSPWFSKIRIEGKVTMVKRSFKKTTVVEDADILVGFDQKNDDDEEGGRIKNKHVKAPPSI